MYPEFLPDADLRRHFSSGGATARAQHGPAVRPAGERLDAAQLIREGEHAGALARLSVLTHSNPENSSLRILMAYAQLQLGNLTGALDEAKKAHEAPNGNSYRCYFLAKIAFLTGDDITCRRELNHAKNAGDMPEEVRQLQNDVKKAKAKS